RGRHCETGQTDLRNSRAPFRLGALGVHCPCLLPKRVNVDHSGFQYPPDRRLLPPQSLDIHRARRSRGGPEKRGPVHWERCLPSDVFIVTNGHWFVWKNMAPYFRSDPVKAAESLSL
ncbi:hypothetical protein BaRGS_00039305, partial [Batillaria attramentaria]